ncbi:MAG TPA: hypothetical protein VFQ38_20845 [Longimicrobiales bacterium]|nr:hypothetical protein [Longimicrobiales bacterium]
MYRTRIAFAALVAAFAAACGPKQTAGPVARADLSGTWVVDRKGDRSPAATSAGADGDQEPAGMTPEERGERRRGGMRGGPSAGRRSDVSPEAVRQALEAVRRAGERIVIQQTDSIVHISYADRSYFDYRPDGRKVHDIWRGIGRVTAKARWTAAGLEVEREIEDGGAKVVELYSRPAGSARLVVTTTIPGPFRATALRSEYEREVASR